MPKKSEAPDLLSVLRKATAADLLAVQERIKALQAEIDELAAVEKVLSIKIHGKPERRKPVRRSKSHDEIEAARANGNGQSKRGANDGVRLYHLRNRIAKHLLHSGSAKPAILAADIGQDLDEVKKIIDERTDLFRKEPGGEVALTNEGKQSVG